MKSSASTIFLPDAKQNIAHLLDDKRFELVRHDVTEPILLEVDQIYNLACPASPIHYQYNPVKTVKTSVMGTINMLGLAKRVQARILAGFDQSKFTATRSSIRKPKIISAMSTRSACEAVMTKASASPKR